MDSLDWKLVYWRPGMTIEQLKKEVSLQCLKKNNWHMTKTAKELGVSLRQFRNWCNNWYPDRPGVGVWKRNMEKNRRKIELAVEKNPEKAKIIEITYPDH